MDLVALIARIGLGLLIGVLVGLAFFGGLWYTMRRLPQSRHPAALAFSSLAARLVVASVGLYLAVRGGSMAGALGAIAGLLLVRIALTRAPKATRP